MQPIVEKRPEIRNAEEDGTLEVHLSTHIEADLLQIVVRNSGRWKESITGRTPIGMKNVEKRLQHQFGEKASLQVMNLEETQSVEIILLMPKTHDQEN